MQHIIYPELMSNCRISGDGTHRGERECRDAKKINAGGKSMEKKRGKREWGVEALSRGVTWAALSTPGV